MDKFEAILKTTLLTLALFFTSFTQAQTNISSPYSRFGLGQLHQNNSVRLLSMGGTGIAYKSNDCINTSNPATYSGFDSTSFLFEGGINGIFSQLRNNTNAIYTGNLALNYLIFGFPVGKRFAFSFGLVPYSNMGYSLTDSNTVTDIGDINYHYKGEGGFNKFFGGTSVKIIKNLSLGANMSYIFGSLSKTRTITFPESVNLYSIRENSATRISDIAFDYGLHYDINFKNGNTLSLGAVTGTDTRLNASNATLTESFSGLTYGSTYIKDTLVNEELGGIINIPAYYGGGLIFRKSNRWMLGADYKMQEWSKYKAFGISDSLQNSMQASLGFSLFPSPTASSLPARTTYRFGIRVAQTYLQLKNTQLNEYGISFGLGIPMQRSKSTINLGFEIGQRGTVENNLIQETFGMITCSLSIYERWFIRRKFD